MPERIQVREMKRISLTDGAGGTAMEKLIKDLVLGNISLKKVGGGVGKCIVPT